MVRPATLALVAAGALCLVAGARAPDLYLDHDEVEHLHAAWLTAIGDAPYRDFAETHNPAIWYAIAPLLPDGDDPATAVLAGRLLMLACTVASLVLAALLARRTGARGDAALLAPLLLAASAYWLVYGLQVRPDVPMTTFVLLGLWLGVPSASPPGPRRALAAGVAFGLATVVLTKAAATGAVLGAAYCLLTAIRSADRRAWATATAALAAGAVLPLLAFAAWLHGAGLLDAFWTWNFRIQKPYLLGAGPSDFGVLEVAAESIRRDAPLWAALAAALVHAALRPAAGRLTLIAAVAAVFAMTATLRLPNYQYLFPALALCAPLGAAAFDAIAHRRAAAVAVAVLVTAASAVAAVGVASLPDNAAQLARMDAVLRLVPPGDTVLASPPHHPIFRRDALYVWFLNPDLHRALDSLDPGPPCDRYRDDPARLRAAPPAAIVTAGAKYHPFYGVGPLARERYAPTADPEVLVRVR
ncbi:MAG: glycosyltransferase family 39 protein [Deltaproteobacteria bacterium]|nr:glycosyltransferase family 39 protein [Deltaproteobacteria bacterium]